MICGRDREITLAVARTVAQIVLFPARVPPSLFSVDVVKAVLLALVEAAVVEDEKLSFGAEVSRVGNATGSKVQFGLAGYITRVTIILLFRNRIDYIANQDQRGYFGKWVEQREGSIGFEQHVAFVNRCPTP